MSSGDWLGIFLLYGVFGFAAMLVLGIPLLFCFLRFGWTGFIPFMLAGGALAWLTSFAVLGGGHNLPLVELFGLAGILSGFCFRLILFGFRHPTTAT
jgi:hypothetical protein